jgi:hypothetical protein
MSAAKLAPQACPRKQGLAESIRDVINHIIALNTEMMGHLARGDADKMDDLRDQLAHARIRKDSLLESYNQHAKVHGC